MISVRNVVFGTLTAASAWPAMAAAQERRPESRPRVYVEPQVKVGEKIRMITNRRARLGVTVDLRASDNDSIGATIESVTPGGPAAKAGLKSGDIITRLDGKLLVTAEGRKADEDESLPGVRLIEIAAQLKPKDTVSVEYRREGTRKTVSLVTGDEPIANFSFVYPDWTELNRGGVMQPKIQIERTPGGARAFSFGEGDGFFYRFGTPLMDLELAPLNADLGAYFGTTEGVLVIDVPKESSLGVKGGDVIQSIDGRKVTGPAGLHRILRSYDPGDSFKLEIMRNKSRMTVTGTLEKPKDM